MSDMRMLEWFIKPTTPNAALLYLLIKLPSGWELAGACRPCDPAPPPPAGGSPL